MKQFQITSQARHLCYVFFVDEQYPYEKLYDLMCSNQRIWGGRYNPIIPVKDNIISDRYIALLKYYPFQPQPICHLFLTTIVCFPRYT